MMHSLNSMTYSFNLTLHSFDLMMYTFILMMHSFNVTTHLINLMMHSFTGKCNPIIQSDDLRRARQILHQRTKRFSVSLAASRGTFPVFALKRCLWYSKWESLLEFLFAFSDWHCACQPHPATPNSFDRKSKYFLRTYYWQTFDRRCLGS